MQKLWIALLLIVLVASGATAREILIDGKTAGTAGLELTADRIAQRGTPALEFSAAADRLVVEDETTAQGDFTHVTVPGWYSSDDIGAPALPVLNRMVEVPEGATLAIRMLNAETKEMTAADLGIAHPIFPKQPPRPKTGDAPAFAYEASAYMHKGWQQFEPVTVAAVGAARNVRIAMVRFYPVAYNPAENKFRVTSRVKFELVLSGANLSGTKRAGTDYESPAFGFLASKVLRPDSLAPAATRGKAKVGYLIVTDKLFVETLAPFIELKKKQGFVVDVLSTEGMAGVQAGVKAAIADRYNNPTPDKPAPSYVLFVGDHEQIPAFPGTGGGHITDLPYVSLTAGDNIPDILTGRFSAKTVDELVPQIEKTLFYETGKFDPAYLSHVVLIAGWDSSHTAVWGYPQINYGTKYYFNKESGVTNPHVYLSAGSGQNSSNILADINAGACFVNYTAHGSPTSWADPSMSISQINAMTNKGKYPIVIGNCCLTNKFEVGTCFGEAMLRAKDKGAVGYIGGTNSTYWDEDLWWGVGNYPIVNPNPQGVPVDRDKKTSLGAYDVVFQGKTKTPAGMLVMGNLAVEESNSPRKLYYWEVYQLMGDPSLEMRIGK